MTDEKPDPSEELERCYLSAVRILNYRFNSVVELRRKLSVKKFERATIDSTIERLRREKWLDDARFAGAFTRTRSLKNIGPQRIRRELIAAGVEDDVAAEAVRANIDAEREEEGAIALCEKKMRIIARRHGPAYLRTDEGRKKLAVYLLNHGYDRVFDVIDKCLKRAGREPERQ